MWLRWALEIEANNDLLDKWIVTGSDRVLAILSFGSERLVDLDLYISTDMIIQTRKKPF